MKNSSQGFALVEIMVSVGIMGIIALGMIRLSEHGLKSQAAVEQKHSVTSLHSQIYTFLENQNICSRNFGLGPFQKNVTAVPINILVAQGLQNALGVIVYNIYDNVSGTPVYENSTIRIRSLILQNYQAMTATEGQLDLAISLDRNKDSNGPPTFAPRIIKLKVKIDGANNINSCIAFGGNDNQVWTKNADATVFYNGGNVGIGTTNPDKNLHVTFTNNVNDETNARVVVENLGTANAIFGTRVNSVTAAGGIHMSVGDYLGSANRGALVYDHNFQHMAIYTNAADWIPKMVIKSSGNVGIGTLEPGYKLDVIGDVNIAAANVLRFGGTQVCASAGCTAVSDRRLKVDIQLLQNSLDNILKLQGVSYDWIDKEKYGQSQQIGLIAQDLEKVYPQAVVTDQSSGLKSVAYDHLVAPLIEAFKSMNARLNELYASFNKVSAEQSREIASVKAEANVKAAKLEVDNAAKDKKIKELEQRLEKIEKAFNSKY